MLIQVFKILDNLQVSMDSTLETTYKEFDELCHPCIANIGYLKKSHFPQKIMVPF